MSGIDLRLNVMKQGFDVYLLYKDNIDLLQQVRIKMVHFAWDSEKDSRLIVSKLQIIKDITGIDKRRAAVYIFTNYNTDFEFDLLG